MIPMIYTDQTLGCQTLGCPGFSRKHGESLDKPEAWNKRRSIWDKLQWKCTQLKPPCASDKTSPELNLL